MDLKFEMVESEAEASVGAKIKILGVGGCGCNIVNDMCESDMVDVDLVGINTDIQTLNRINLVDKIQIGKELRGGRGAGNKPEVGAKAAEEDRDNIENMLRGTDLLFIAAGLGGGTGSGASPVIAEIARELGILTVTVVVTPFEFELDEKKTAIVNESLEKLRSKVNDIIVIPNDRIYEACDRQMELGEAYREANRALINTINGLVAMITNTGYQNIDFEDVRTCLEAEGEAFIGIGRASGTEKVRKAFDTAINNPFTGKVDMDGATHILVNIVGNINIEELKEINNLKGIVGGRASVKLGYVNDDSLGEDIEIVVLISGINGNRVVEQVEENKIVEKADNMNNWVKKTIDENYDDIDRPAFQRTDN